MKNIKRMFKYIKKHKLLVTIGILMVLVVQVLEFLSPLLVKTILDDYISGIEYEWVEVEEPDSYTVSYNNSFYKQRRHLNEGETEINDFSIFIYQGSYYSSFDKINAGIKTLDGDILTVVSGEDTFTYTVSKLTGIEVVNFYKPVFKILVILISLLFLRSFLTIIFSYIQRICNNKVMTSIALNGRLDAIEAVERLPIKYFEDEPAGKMASRIVNDVDGMIALYRNITNVILGGILSFIFAYIGMFYLDAKLALLSFIIYPFVYIWVKFFLKKLRVVAVKVNEYRSLMLAKINEIINGINILQIFNFKYQTINEFNKINDNFIDNQLKEVKLHITTGWNMIGIIRGVITVVIVMYFGSITINGTNIVITAGLIYAYNEYLLKITNPINLIFTQVGEIQHALVQTERIHKIIEGPKEDDTLVHLDRYKGDIKFKNVWFAYNENDYVLKGIDFHILPNQSIGLVGHTGSGKSSLMNLLLRFYDLKPNEGEILVDDIPITTYSKRSYREHVGIVLQEPVLFKGTIATNIRFGKENISDDEVESVLRKVGGGKIIDRFENGINQEVTRTGGNMSSGEKQIIALARILIHDPAILIMDEATSHIDTETEQMIKNALEVVRENRTMIIIAHRLSTIQNCDNIIVLNHGLKIEEGTHEQLLKNDKEYANIYRAQVVDIKE